MYYVKLDNDWNEKEGNIYWLSVEAMYTNSTIPYPWGWLTTDTKNNWNDDAVFIDGVSTNDMTYPPPGWTWVTNHPDEGESVNMAYVLFTDVCPRRSKKWSQPPDMTMGENMPSYSISGETGEWPLRADDWLCDGRRITDIHWWGSYLNWATSNPGPVDPPADSTNRPVGFTLSWHEDIPAEEFGYSMPSNPAIKEIFVSIDQCHEMYYGPVFQSWKEPPVYEHEYQYYVDLLDPAAGEPWHETNGVIYWLNIQAVFPPTWDPFSGMHEGWGWKTTPPNYHWQDVSVVASNTSPPWLWQPGYYPTNHPYATNTLDLAFELTTDEVGTNKWGTPIVITNIVYAAATNEYEVASVGTWGAGAQVLQSSTNLLTTNWTAVGTNALPLSLPYTNKWFRPDPAYQKEFFRILEQ